MLFSRIARSIPIRRAFYTTEAPSGLTEGEKLIFTKLSEALNPHKLQVADVSGGCGSMYAINIAAKKFEGTSIVKQHRMVNEILKEEIKGMHGLQLKTSAK
ncbi:bola protein [Gilbertella persicaria]|uniref:bola protein n=1 Tax=Gilbertella persicaria TaxID=101096 RepID=UPI00221F3BAF|nr:bola protein [Gilbertella persicaria]KAI8092285.1 bola protein [Gilbertella persicaria]